MTHERKKCVIYKLVSPERERHSREALLRLGRIATCGGAFCEGPPSTSNNSLLSYGEGTIKGTRHVALHASRRW